MQKHNNVKSKLHKIQKIKYSVPRHSAKQKRGGRQNNLKCIYKSTCLTGKPSSTKSIKHTKQNMKYPVIIKERTKKM